MVQSNTQKYRIITVRLKIVIVLYIVTNMASADDFLDEDPAINSQKYVIISYLLPDQDSETSKSSGRSPMLKIRGSYSTVEECSKRIKKLQIEDTYFNMYCCEVGKWGYLLKNSELEKLDDVDVVYQEETMNEMVKEYKENRDKSTLEFEERKNSMRKQAAYEGSKKGHSDPELIKQKYSDITEQIKQVQDTLRTLELNQDELAEKLLALGDTSIIPGLIPDGSETNDFISNDTVVDNVSNVSNVLFDNGVILTNSEKSSIANTDTVITTDTASIDVKGKGRAHFE